MMEKLATMVWGRHITGAAIFFLVLVAFLPTLGYEFVNWDDPTYVLDNNTLSVTNWQSFLELIFNPYLANWHPLTMLSLALDHAIWGIDPFGYHLTNVVLHGLNALCVYVLALALLSHKSLSLGNRRILLSASLTAIFFALHPLRVESVAWISERKDVLYALFYLLATVAYLSYVNATGKQRTLRYIALCLLFALSLLGKPMAVTLPALLLVLDIYPLGRIHSRSQLLQMLKEKLPLFLLAILFTFIAFQTQESGGAIKSMVNIPLWDRIVNAIHAYMFYLYKLLLPLHLSPFYPHPALTKFRIAAPAYLLSATLFFTLTIASLTRWRVRAPQLAVAWWSYLLMTLPVIGLVHVGGQYAADRYTYLPLIGICMLVAVKMAGWIDNKSWRRFLGLGLIVLALPLMLYQTLQQMRVWADSGRLWDRVIDLYPEADALPYYNRGLWLEGRPNGSALAIADYTTAIRLQPAHRDALVNRGILLAESGDTRGALNDFDRAISLAPRSASGYINRGSLQHRLGNLELAAMDYQRALQIEPRNPVALYNLGLIRKRQESNR